MVNQEEFEQKCYEAYKLDWMLSHGHTLTELMGIIVELVSASVEEDPENMIKCEQHVREIADVTRYEFLQESGFNGSLWVCKEEFLNAEFLDPDYMKHLFSAMMPDKENILTWQKITKRRIPEDSISVETTAGTISAYADRDGQIPGIGVLFTPKDFDEEIDVCGARVYQEKEISTDDADPQDLAIFTYADPYTEDYTSKNIIKRSSFEEALS
ncbi:MAG: hypothetical protein IKS48_01500 [Eubacterium sp.]|nr:hypothetical protein [Lachnospiraceae bacterium]MBR6402042.1 hypothetical protein [Eubacterium sp.]